MIITVSSYKGGVAKTTTAIHLAAYLNAKSPALLVDYDPNRSALAWAQRGHLPFSVIDEKQIARHARNFEHIIADTEVSPKLGEIKALAEGCDLLVVPTTPDALALDALLMTVEALQAAGADHFRVLLCIVPPFPSRAGEEARETLTAAGLPLFRGSIRRFVAHQKAALTGVTVDQADDPHAEDGWEDYRSIGREILK